MAGGFRELYKDGPEEHYKRAGDVYRNPHERAVRRAVQGAVPQGARSRARALCWIAAEVGVPPLTNGRGGGGGR